NSGVEIDLNLLKDVEVSNFQTFMDNDMEEIELQEDEWGDDEDSGWENDLDLEQEKKCRDRLISSKLELTWTDNNELEKKKRGLYMKAASANKITTYFPVHNNPSSEINENLELIEIYHGLIQNLNHGTDKFQRLNQISAVFFINDDSYFSGNNYLPKFEINQFDQLERYLALPSVNRYLQIHYFKLRTMIKEQWPSLLENILPSL
ncbi:763_t:CDS:2, partial [Entrophospora sp. SA101]